MAPPILPNPNPNPNPNSNPNSNSNPNPNPNPKPNPNPNHKPHPKKKSMEIFLRDPAGVVPKGVPPDKRVGACPSVQEKTTGIGNVGKSPCEGTYAENQSLKVQENPRENPVVANQEDIPTGDRKGIWRKPTLEERLAAYCMVCSKVYEQAKEARTTSINTAYALIYSTTEQDLKERQEVIEKEKATVMKANAYVWQITLESIMHMKRLTEYYDECSPGCVDERVTKEMIDSFVGTLKLDTFHYEATQKDSYFQLLLSRVDKGEALHEQIVSEARAEQEKAEEEAAAETAADQKLTAEHRVLAQQQAEERAIAEKRATGK